PSLAQATAPLPHSRGRDGSNVPSDPDLASSAGIRPRVLTVAGTMESEPRAGSGARTRGPKLGKRLGSPRAVLDRTGSSGKLFPRRNGDGPVILQLYMLFKTSDDLTLLLLSFFESPFGRDAGTEPPGVNTLAASRDRLPYHGRRTIRRPRLRETGGTRCLVGLKTNPRRRSPSTLLGER